MTGMVDRFLSPPGMAMPLAILMSLIVAFTVAPMLPARWLGRPARAPADPGRRPVHAPAPGHERTGGLYQRTAAGCELLLKRALGHRVMVVLECLAVLMPGGPLGQACRKGIIRDDGESELNASVRAPEATSLAAAEGLVSRIAAGIRKVSEVAQTAVPVADGHRQTPTWRTPWC